VDGNGGPRTGDGEIFSGGGGGRGGVSPSNRGGVGMSTQTGGGSRLSKTNRADHENRSVGPSIRESLKQPLTDRDGVGLRVDALDDNRDGVQPQTWRGTVLQWRDWYEESAEVDAVFRNPDGDTVKGSTPNRFHPDYADKQYAKLKDLERGISEDYGSLLHTAMLTFTASSQPGSSPLPPVDHLDELLSSWDAVRRALSRVLDGKRFEYLAILEPHKSGYIHVHIAVFVEGFVSAGTFGPVVDAHLRNCDLAERDAHDIEDDSTVSVRWAGGDRDDSDGDHLDELAIYLAEYLGTYGESPLEQETHVQMADAVLWATGRQRWRPSNGAQEYMATNRSEPNPDWELVGVEDGDGELHEVGSGGGGVTKMQTDIPPPVD